jgi:hypothetical protein
MRKTTKNLSQDSFDLKPGLHEYEASVNTDHLSVTICVYVMYSYVDNRSFFE